jgi:hypothetical protein
MTAFEALVLIAKTEFSPLTDREGFAGVENENAVIGDFEGGIIIVDGEVAQLIFDNGEFETFMLKAI